MLHTVITAQDEMKVIYTRIKAAYWCLRCSCSLDRLLRGNTGPSPERKATKTRNMI